jgi:hypothetical protein
MTSGFDTVLADFTAGHFRMLQKSCKQAQQRLRTKSMTSDEIVTCDFHGKNFFRILRFSPYLGEAPFSNSLSKRRDLALRCAKNTNYLVNEWDVWSNSPPPPSKTQDS